MCISYFVCFSFNTIFFHFQHFFLSYIATKRITNMPIPAFIIASNQQPITDDDDDSVLSLMSGKDIGNERNFVSPDLPAASSRGDFSRPKDRNLSCRWSASSRDLCRESCCTSSSSAHKRRAPVTPEPIKPHSERSMFSGRLSRLSGSTATTRDSLSSSSKALASLPRASPVPKSSLMPVLGSSHRPRMSTSSQNPRSVQSRLSNSLRNSNVTRRIDATHATASDHSSSRSTSSPPKPPHRNRSFEDPERRILDENRTKF